MAMLAVIQDCGSLYGDWVALLPGQRVSSGKDLLRLLDSW